MAIFGKAIELNYTTGKDILLREGNNWDVFLNYFFAVFFIFCFIIGILLNPFIIAYHAQQKKTFAKFLFLLVSSMDLFKSLYFPLVLVPKLLSSLGEDDYYYNWDLSTVSWTSHLNSFISASLWFEVDVMVVLNVSRYFSITRPLSSSMKRIIILSAVLLFFLLNRLATFLSLFFYEDVLYNRIYDCIVSKQLIGTSYSIFRSIVYFLSSTVGGIFIYLTVLHLKNSDTASSEVSTQNVRRGIASLVAMSVFNVFLLLFSVGYYVAMYLLKESDWIAHSTTFDFVQFLAFYGSPLSQSVFNSFSILVICTSFRDFVKICVRERRIADIS